MQGTSSIDERQATEMLHFAIEHGVNYVDTAYPYHDGQSEAFLGKALLGGYREQVKLATKLPSWEVDTLSDCDRILNEQLTKLKTDSLDLYLLHSLNAANWERMCQLNVLDWLEQKQAEGIIQHVGFSFHDELDVFTRIVEGTDLWSFCQIQYNFMDVEYQAGKQGLRLAHDRELAVVVMEPLHGGQLAKRIPDPIQAIWAKAKQARGGVEWALLWVWNQPEVSLLLSGMSTLDQVKQNVSIASLAGQGLLTEEELRLIDEVREAYRRLSPVGCTGCGYCQPCPSSVTIPRILELYNNAVMYQEPDESRADYLGMDATAQADRCTECGTCEEKCPQHLEIMDWLKTAHAFFTGRT